MKMFILKGHGNSSFDAALVERVEKMFGGGDVLQRILEGHLLVERALIAKIVDKMARPSVFGPNSRWTFANLSQLYVGLYDSLHGEEMMLRQLNMLRNAVAHTLVDVYQAVDKYIPADEEGLYSDRSMRVAIFVLILLYNLGAISEIKPGHDFSSS